MATSDLHVQHVQECYAFEALPCPQCSAPVRQLRLQCCADQAQPTQCDRCSLACPDCPAEVRITEGLKLARARVIHAADCSWYRRYQAREVTGCIPCRTFVTHRGPYKRDPEASTA